MTPVDTDRLRALDKACLWHPFTQMRDWSAPGFAPILLVEGEGALLRDSEGREYLDGNASIWANLHGHAHPKINAAIRAQLDRVAHTSFLGFTHPLAAELGAALLDLWPRPEREDARLSRVFYSDNGSTAMEAAIKMAIQARQLRGEPERHRFVAFTNAYHGDTMGASSLGGVQFFHQRFGAYQFPTDHVCSLEELEAQATSGKIDPRQLTAVVIEPIIQGVAGMRLWPEGMLARLRQWCDIHRVWLIADEVMTGFGRTGRWFASQHEGVTPDLVAVAKGITGGYLPLAATLTTETIFNAFLGGYSETFFYGHTYTANPLGCAAALASLEIFREERLIEERLPEQIAHLANAIDRLRAIPGVSGVRQCGMIAAFDVVQTDGHPFDPALRMGNIVTHAAQRHGLLTRPIRDAIVIMPPYCMTPAQMNQMIDALIQAVKESLENIVSPRSGETLHQA